MRKAALAARLRKVSKEGFVKQQELVNVFASYFADWLKDVYPEDEFFVYNYANLIAGALFQLCREKVEDHAENRELHMLISMLKVIRVPGGVNIMEEKIKDFFLLEEVVEFLVSKRFYDELIDFLAKKK